MDMNSHWESLWQQIKTKKKKSQNLNKSLNKWLPYMPVYKMHFFASNFVSKSGASYIYWNFLSLKIP